MNVQGLPLALKAPIISQGLTITHAQGIRDGVGEIHGMNSSSIGLMKVSVCSVDMRLLVCIYS